MMSLDVDSMELLIIRPVKKVFLHYCQKSRSERYEIKPATFVPKFFFS